MTQARAAKSPINPSTQKSSKRPAKSLAEAPVKAPRKAPTKALAKPAAAEAAAAPAPAKPLTGARRIQVRESGVHGKGVFTVAPIPKGDIVIEYKGDVITWKQALKQHPHDPSQPNHTFFFHIDDKRVIDGNANGNAARWINHACKTNCEADEVDGRVFIKAKRDLEPGEELFYDYGLVIEGPITKKLKKDFECRCGAKKCRGTMLAAEKKDEKKKKKKSKKDKH